jgi:hypothetical protein
MGVVYLQGEKTLWISVSFLRDPRLSSIDFWIKDPYNRKVWGLSGGPEAVCLNAGTPYFC